MLLIGHFRAASFHGTTATLSAELPSMIYQFLHAALGLRQRLHLLARLLLEHSLLEGLGAS